MSCQDIYENIYAPKLETPMVYFGSKKPKDAKIDDIYVSEEGLFICTGEDQWEYIYTDLSADHIETGKPKTTVCPHCGAPVNGYGQCDYCGGFI